MNVSIFLAKFWGWYLLLFFLVLSFNPTKIKEIFINLKDPKFLMITAFIAIVIGLLNILFHNKWELSWWLILTLIGWIALGIGLLLFLFPVETVKWLDFINIKLVQVLYMLLFFIGAYLLNISYELLP